eukprot:SAG22_NODE_1761_length_3632_cov_33.614492_4_plen_83_part_00
MFGGGVGTVPRPLRWAFGWGPPDLYLGAALGKAAYAVGSAGFTGIYLICSRNPVCPLGNVYCLLTMNQMPCELITACSVVCM